MKGMIKLSLSIILCMILALCMVQAAPPVFTSSSIDGLEIESNIFSSIPLQSNYTINVHAYNKSNGVPVTSNLNCTLHVYNNSGNQIYEKSSTTFSHTYDIEFAIPGSVFASLGEHQYIVHCVRGNQGGFLTLEFTVIQRKFSDIKSMLNSGMRTISWILRICAIFGFILLIIWLYGTLGELNQKKKRMNRGEFDEQEH